MGMNKYSYSFFFCLHLLSITNICRIPHYIDDLVRHWSTCIVSLGEGILVLWTLKKKNTECDNYTSHFWHLVVWNVFVCACDSSFTRRYTEDDGICCWIELPLMMTLQLKMLTKMNFVLSPSMSNPFISFGSTHSDFLFT